MMVSSMKRARKKIMPPIPHSYQQYEELLEGHFEDPDGTKYFYKRIGEEETESVVFIVEPIGHLLNEAREIHLDGTFKVVPNVPSSRQLFTILAMKNEHVSKFLVTFIGPKLTIYGTVMQNPHINKLCPQLACCK